ncbi:MAG: hypothetical protein JWN67_995 [Actinomycetia bacterium]|nr:hypothetical protein [Actinomycetes bacterium]
MSERSERTISIAIWRDTARALSAAESPSIRSDAEGGGS